MLAPGGTLADDMMRTDVCVFAAQDAGWILGLGRSPGVGNGNPLLYSCLENSMDRGVWQAIDQGVSKSQTLTEHTAHNTPENPLNVKTDQNVT